MSEDWLEPHWQSLFQNSSQPLFLLDGRRSLRFVNLAWLTLTGLLAADVQGRICTRRGPAGPTLVDAVLRALAPPSEVRDGRTVRARRLVPQLGAASDCWDVEFVPIAGVDGLAGIVGRIQLSRAEKPHADGLTELHEQTLHRRARDEQSEGAWQPEVLAALRQRASERYALDHLDSSSPVLQQIGAQVRLASGSLTPVRIVGEAGSGKQWLARAIHLRGVTKERPFIALDAAHLPHDVLSASLFGEGAARRISPGTIYLKNAGSLPRDLQSRSCDWLTLGEDGHPPYRLIAGDAVDWVDAVRAGRMLEQFRCVLSTMTLELPPLRERRADLPRLVERMLERASSAGERTVVGLTAEASELVQAYAWPGNLRELYAVLLHAVLRPGGERIEANELPSYLRRAVRLEQAPGATPPHALPLDRLLEQAERRLILLALERTHGHKARAADLLEIPRPRLFRRMKALGLTASDEGEAPIDAVDE